MDIGIFSKLRATKHLPTFAHKIMSEIAKEYWTREDMNFP